MEFTQPKESLDAMVALFAFLVENAIVSEYQVAKGLSRLKKVLPDLSLDIPSAPELLKDFEDMARERDCLPTTMKAVENVVEPTTDVVKGEEE